MGKQHKAKTVIEDAQRMLAAGDVENARTLLLQHGYIESLNAEVQAAYLDMIPVNPRLKSCLETKVAKLSSEDSSERLVAAKQLAKDALRETSVLGLESLGDPRVTGALLKALSDEDERVAEEATIALAEITRCYLRDYRSVDGFRQQLSSNREITRLWALKGLSFFIRQKAVPELIAVLSDRSAKVRAEALRHLTYLFNDGLLDMDVQQTVQKLAVLALDNRAEEVRIAAANLIGRLGTVQHASSLQQHLKKEKSQAVKRRLKAALEHVKARSN